MKKINLYLLLSLFIAFTACDDNDDEDDLLGNWVTLGGFPGPSVANAVAFTIGDSAYICTGYNGTSSDRYDFLYVYNADQDFWQQREDFPREARNSAVAFATSTLGFVGTGANEYTEFKNFCSYDPSTNSWDTNVTDFPGVARYEAVAFCIDDIGYVGTGYDGDGTSLKDFWKYDPSSNSWEEIVSIPGDKRYGASAFVIEGKAYVCGGVASGYSSDFYSYDPSTGTWTKLHELYDKDDASFDDDYDEIPRKDAAAFSVGGRGYIAAGNNGSALNTVWEYDPGDDRWEEKTGIDNDEGKGVGVARTAPIGFAVNDVGYVATGYSGATYYYDMYKFEPFEDTDEDD